jgi:hypothetical protein
VFNGRSHKEILDDSFIGENWSSHGMNFLEVQSLLGQLRQSREKTLMLKLNVPDEARRIAANVAKLPELTRKNFKSCRQRQSPV